MSENVWLDHGILHQRNNGGYFEFINVHKIINFNNPFFHDWLYTMKRNTERNYGPKML